MGGGEQHAGAAAAVLAEHFDVELIGMEDFDRDRFSSILGRPVLASLPLRIVGLEPTAIAEVSREYDLFINHSYTSEDVSLAENSIYVVFFPQAYGESAARKVKRHFKLVCPDISSSASLSHDKVRFSDSGEIVLKARESGRMSMSMIGHGSSISIENELGVKTFEDGGSGRYLVAFDFPKGKTRLTISGENVSVLVPQLANGQRIPFAYKSRMSAPVSPAFIDSYDLVLANSGYTQSWIESRWHRPSVVHYPPVELRHRASEKENLILSVGRFFDESRGHCKQQLRLVRAFKKMVDAGLSDWKLVLIGGCDKANREYALQVRREAVGYPIEVRLNAGFDVLDDHLARASIYWHATGFGVNLDEFPDRAEHFGIAPVEAMSTGAIPIVYGLGGPSEIVDFGRNGFFFMSEDELIAHTRHVIDMPEDQRSQIGRVAAESAQRFSPDRFANELLEHVRGLLNRGMFDR